METSKIEEARREVGEQLRKARKDAGMTLEQVADICGIDNTAISRIENGTRNASVDIIARIAAAVGMRLDFAPKK